MKEGLKRTRNTMIIVLFSLVFVLCYSERNLKAVTLEPVVNYSTYVQNSGWQGSTSEGLISGTTGKSLQMQGIKIYLENALPGMSIEYSAYIKNYGWTSYTSNGNIVGKPGVLSIEAIKIRLVGAPSNFHVQYKTHVQNKGWLNWSQDGGIAGTVGQGLRMEAVKIQLVDTSYDVGVDYTAHSQGIGWMSDVVNGSVAGTTGQSLRMEALKVKLTLPPSNMGITYQSYAKGLGWLGNISNNAVSGTTGQSRQLESIRINLTNALSGYHVEYSVHIQGIGWTPYVTDGIAVGVAGSGLRIEAIKIKVYYVSSTPSPQPNQSYVVPTGGTIKYYNMPCTLSQATAVQANKGSAVTFSKGVGTSASSSQINTVLDPNNNKSLQQTAQFIKLNQYYNVITATNLNNYLADKGILIGQGQAFINAASQNNINVLGLVAHAIWETGNGKSALAQGILVSTVGGKSVIPKKVYNFFGIGAIDSSAVLSGSEQAYNAGWTSPAAAISGGATWISNNYINSTKTNQNQFTAYLMRWNYLVSWHEYATDINWTRGIANIVSQIYPYCSNTNMEFDIPVYK